MNDIIRIQDYTDTDYDPYTAALTYGGEGAVTDPFPELRQMRQQASVWPGDLREQFGIVRDMTTLDVPAFSVLGFQEVAAVLSDPVTYSNKAYEKNLGVYFGRSVTVMDAPEHTQYRRLFQKSFMPGMVADWSKTMVPNIMNRYIDRFSASGKADLVADYTLQFPFQFILELMALPEQDGDIFRKLAFGQLFITFDPEHGMEAVNKLKTYLTDLVHQRREHPASDNDMIHNMAVAEIDGERLPDDVVISFFRQLMTAGADTSFHAFSNLLAALLTHPDQLEAVRNDRSLVPEAIEEGLRWEGPIMMISRTPTREVTLGGVTIQPGDIMNIVVASANRDENEYPEPDRFDIFRKNKRNVAFGRGPHICIGQHLARMEMASALNALLDRLPNLRLDPDMPPPTIKGFSLRAPEALHVKFDAA